MNTSSPFAPDLRKWMLGFLCLPMALDAQQGVCDSLNIVSVQYAPFVGADLQVNVANPTSELFGYPRFSLLNNTGDTLARETLEFFGLGVDIQAHNMLAVPGSPAATTPFTGTLVLQYSTANGDLTCAFPVTAADLCPPPPCSDMMVLLGSNTPVTTTADWSVTDDTGTTAASGEFSLDANGMQSVAEPVCLPPGAYVLHVSQTVAAGTSFDIGVTQDNFITYGPTGTLLPGQSAELSFNFYPACEGIAQGIAEGGVRAPRCTQDGRVIHITNATARPLGPMGVFDIMGRSVLVVGGTSSEVSMDLSGSAPGIYLLRSLAAANTWTTQRFVLP